MRPAFEFLAYPFHTRLRVVFGVGEETIQIVALEQSTLQFSPRPCILWK